MFRADAGPGVGGTAVSKAEAEKLKEGFSAKGLMVWHAVSPAGLYVGAKFGGKCANGSPGRLIRPPTAEIPQPICKKRMAIMGNLNRHLIPRE